MCMSVFFKIEKANPASFHLKKKNKTTEDGENSSKESLAFFAQLLGKILKNLESLGVHLLTAFTREQSIANDLHKKHR